MVIAFLVPAPARAEPQGLSAAWPAVRDPRVGVGMWLTLLAGLAFGVVDVLAPLRLSRLGASAVVIGGTFLASAAIEAGLSPMAGRLADRRGELVPVRLSLAAAVVVSLLAPVVAPAAWLIALLIVGMPAFGTLFAPATALLSSGAERLGLNQGLAFGLGNLAWATGQAGAAAAGGAIAQATSDFVPYALLAGACLGTLIVLRPGRARLVRRLTTEQAEPQRTTGASLTVPSGRRRNERPMKQRPTGRLSYSEPGTGFDRPQREEREYGAADRRTGAPGADAPRG
jgi:MFS family permease